MKQTAIINQRLLNQQIAATSVKTPHELVSWLGPMQSQDFGMAKWAIGLRLPGLRDVDVEDAFNKGAILRTHMMRPTWHFVTPEDIGWIQKLTAHRVHAASASMYRKTGMNSKMFARCNDLLAKILQGNNYLTRDEIKTELQKIKLKPDNLQMVYLLMNAELECLICSGPRKGRQFTYALLEERAPVTGPRDREEALAKFTERYFASRGPATLQDFAWWSGFTIKEAREGVAMLSGDFAEETVDGKAYIFQPGKAILPARAQTTFLLPDFDEYGISYKDRSVMSGSKTAALDKRGGNVIFNHVVVVDGMIAGTWQRMKNNAVEVMPFSPLSKAKQQALRAAVKKYEAFIK